MGICTDSATTYLRRIGYNVVRHPREGIEPLALIGTQRGETAHLGTLDKLIVRPPGPLPAITRDKIAGDVQGQTSSKLKTAIGVSVLKSALSALGGNVGASVGYDKAKTIQFVFEHVLTDSVEPLDLGNYLKAAEVDVDNLVLQQYVLGNGRLFVITRTVKTNTFTIKAESSSSPAAALDVPAIQAVASGSLKVDASAQASGTVSYQGTAKLVFGFQCFEVGVVDGVLSLTSTKSGSIAMDAATAKRVDPTIIDDTGLLELG